MLSSVSAWRNIDIDFSHVEFYFAIVDCFEVMPRPVAKARVEDLVLNWWNRQVRFMLQYVHNQLKLSTYNQEGFWPHGNYAGLPS